MRRALIALALAVPLISQPALVDSFWNLLAAAWADSSLDEGCGGDSNGICGATLDEGCGADPSGGPRCSS